MEHKSDGNMVSVPYIVYEGEAVRADKRYKRLLIALVITIVLMFISNALWRTDPGKRCYFDSGGDMVSRLKDMMNETDDPHEKRELREFITSIEQR